jgi:SAM-dependent methyltransferase
MREDGAEWLDPKLEYHERQFRQVYRSTERFCDWLNQIKFLVKDRPARVADIACGMGANLAYMGTRYPSVSFTGVDINPELIVRGNDWLQRNSVANCRLVAGDLYSLTDSHRGAYDGIVSYQTLSWLPDFEAPLQAMTGVGAEWIALTSLFFDGDINCWVRLHDYSRPVTGKPYRESYYNIYSLSRIRDLFALYGYTEFVCQPFEIDIDLPKPTTPGMGTYTELLSDGRRIQRSGPLVLPWYFVGARRHVESRRD